MLVDFENVTRIDLFVVKLSALRIERAKNTARIKPRTRVSQMNKPLIES